MSDKARLVKLERDVERLEEALVDVAHAARLYRWNAPHRGRFRSMRTIYDRVVKRRGH